MSSTQQEHLHTTVDGEAVASTNSEPNLPTNRRDRPSTPYMEHTRQENTRDHISDLDAESEDVADNPGT